MRLGIFVDRQTMGHSAQLESLISIRDTAEEMGHEVYFIFPTEINKISKVDGLFIRSRTDPMNISYIAARFAEENGIRAIDDSDSIRICADKVNMYMHLMKNNINIPKTKFIKKEDLGDENIKKLFEELGDKIILKEPSTCFSARVEKVCNAEELKKISRKYLKLSDWIVAQEYVPSKFDWRVGVLDGKIVYVCKYIIPEETFKIQASINGHIVYCKVESVKIDEVPKEVIDIGISAANAIGNGLYGVDIKQSNGDVYVIEVNDNPSLDGGENGAYPNLYADIINSILNKRE